ncbi:hypothetical protein [Actinotalea sp. K2]|uniref:hypothetical protein n=1 Tax=Actinotalea sp. K2 TaxID=2939438 RepID=UPI002016CB3D|nr:hypothetical protein [Actinotalea sp. K2]MCL3861008.1 hypothetical protein [Actinotalea sp. K2]
MSRPDLVVDWTIPDTGSGWSGRIDRFMGPGKTRPEYVVEIVGGVVCVALLAWLVLHTGAYREWSVLQAVIVGVAALDLVGGVLTNATNSAKRWYHRDRPGAARARLVFVGAHVIHLAALGLVVPHGLVWSAANAVLLLAGAALVEAVPVEVRRPVAMVALLAAVTINLVLLPLPTALAWVVPFLFLKLLVCHLVPEAPLRSRHER